MPRLCVVVGYGRYGVLATHIAIKTCEKVVIFDVNPHRFTKRPCVGNPEFINADGCRGVADLIENGVIPDLLAPTAPIHVLACIAVELLRRRGFEARPYPTPLAELAKALLERGWYVGTSLEAGVLTASRLPPDVKGPFTCPAVLGQSVKCPMTGTSVIEKSLKRDTTFILLRLIEARSISNFLIADLVTIGGIGFIKPIQLLVWLRNLRKGDKAVVATMSNCHGVVNAFTIA